MYIANSYLYNSDIFVWLDETGSDRRHFLRKYGYALKGERAIRHTFLIHGRKINAILVISCAGVQAKLLEPFDGSSPHSMVIMDNLSLHHNLPVRTLLNQSGIVVQYLPPYSPDLNLVEAFSYIKSYLKAHENTVEATNDLVSIINAAINSITDDMCRHWIKDCGYVT